MVLRPKFDSCCLLCKYGLKLVIDCPDCQLFAFECLSDETIFEFTPCIHVLARLLNPRHQVYLPAKVLALQVCKDVVGVWALGGFSQLSGTRYV